MLNRDTDKVGATRAATVMTNDWWGAQTRGNRGRDTQDNHHHWEEAATITRDHHKHHKADNDHPHDRQWTKQH
jgi:hypothetical protein